MKKAFVLFTLFLFSLSLCVASPFAKGLDAYARGDWLRAIENFQDAINNAKTENEIETSLYYLIMSLASSGKYKNAVNSSNIFLARYPNSPNHPDVLYQRGRIYCLLGLYEKALNELYSFIHKYPTQKLLPAAYYWTAESLYLTGKLQEARDVFSRILLNYPTSVKAEQAKQRISLIDQIATQKELLTLLQLNKEETQRLSSELQKKQEDYEKTLNEYKDKLTSHTDDKVDEGRDNTRLLELERMLQEEKDKNVELYEKLLLLEAKNKELLDALSMLDQLEEPKQEEEIEETTSEVEKTNDEDAEKERLAREAAEKRRLVLEMLKKKARQLEGMYDEILEEEKNETE